MVQLARKLSGLAVLAALVLCSADAAPARQGADPAIRVDKIKYADLGKLVRSHKGKVVVVDFWADFCVPCKREFPHLVALQNKYKNDGLVAVSVALDDPSDAEARGRIVKFLEKQKAGGLTNLQLDEPAELWQQKLGIKGPPCVYVFNREGRIANKWDDNVDYAEIEKAVAELMKK
jgi:thiol-disulfide isomerase/thioredoxin